MDIIGMNLMWFWIHFLYTVSFTASMKCDDVQFDTTCSDDCSQPARFPGANDTFFCKIHLQKGLKVVKEGNKTLQENAAIAIDAPKLTSVDSYLKPYLVNKVERLNPSLNISFQLPDGFVALGPKTGREYLLKGVLVNFTSVADLRVQDVYYHDCPKYRLFNFSAYRPTYYDSENPRILKYDCFVGLDENDSRVYMIGLQSLPGKGIIYYVTTYSQRQVWKPAIAVAFRNATALHVVFEQASFIFKSYEVELFMSEGNSWASKDRTPAQTISKLPADNSHSFEVVKGGHYFVQVSVIGNKSVCPDECVSKSWIINTSLLVFSTEPQTTVQRPVHAENQSWLDENHRILAAIVGCLAGILLVMLLLYMLWKKRVKTNSKFGGWRKPSVLVVYSYECSEFDNLVQSFAKHIRDKWDIDVYLDLWEETQSQGISESWCSEKLRSVDFLLCICSQGWIETFDNGKVLSSDRQYEEYFKYAVDEVKRMREISDHHCPEILTIYFDFMKCPVPSALKNHPGSYMLTPLSNKLFCHLHNCKNVPRKFNRAVDDLGHDLQGEINKAKLFFETNPEWIVRRIKDKSVIPEPNGKMFTSEKPPSSTESKKTLNSEMKSGKPSHRYSDLDKMLKELNEDPDEEFSGSENGVFLNDHDKKAILATGGEDENMESPSARPLIHPNNLRYDGNNVKPHLQHSHYCRVHSPDHHPLVRNSESVVSEEHLSLLPDQIQKRTSQPGDFKRKIHHDNNFLNHHHRNHYPASPPHTHHKVYQPSQPLRPPAQQQNGKKMSCSCPISSQPDESALFGDPEPKHSHESKCYPHHHRDVFPDECPSLGQSLPHQSWQPQSLVNYEENIVPSFTNYVDTKISSPLKKSHCAKHKDVRDSTTVKPFIDHADSYHDQISFHRMQHLNPQKSWLDPKFADIHQNPYNGHQSSHFAHHNPLQFEIPFMFDQPHSIEISGLSGERYPLHPESDTSFFLNDEEDGEHSFVESQSSLNKQKMYKQKQIPLLSETVPTNKLLHGNSHVSHPQKNFIDENMRSNLYHHNQLQDFKKGMGDVQEESEHLLIQSYPSKTLLNTHSRLHCYAETENQSSNEYQINLQHEEIDEEFVPPEDLSGSDGEREKSKPVSESMESVMEELAAENQSWLDENHRILAAIVGCLAGILLVMLLLYMLWKKRVKTNSKFGGWRKPSVLVVYSYECSEFDNLVQSFAKHIRDKWDIDVYLDLWEETQSQGISESWCSEKLRSVDFLLCICSQGWIETFDNGKVLSSDRQYEEYFKYAVDEVKRMREISDHHCPEILTIYFDFMKCPVPSALKNHPGSYMLTPLSNKLFCHLHNCKNVPRKFNRAVDDLGHDLQGEINKAKLFFETNPEWIVRRIKDKSVIPEPNGKMFTSEKPPSSTESKKTLNSEMKSGKPSHRYSDLDKMLKELNEDPDEEFSGSENGVFLNDHDKKAILATGGEDENMESPSARPLIHPNNLRYDGNNVKPHLQHSHYCRVHSPDHHPLVRNSESVVSEEHLSLLPDQIQKRTSQPGDFKRKIHHDNNFLNHHHRNHYPASPPHTHHKVYQPSQPLRPPAQQQNGKKMSCSCPISSQPDESALFGDPEPKHSHESKCYPHHHRDVFPDECPSLGQSLPHQSWQPQSLVNYEENIVPSFTNYVDTKISSPLKKSHCAKHKDVRDSTTVKPFIDHADSYHDQISFHRMQHLNPQKSWLDPKFADIHQNPYNGHQSSHFAHHNPLQFEIPFMFDQPHSIEISGLSGERYPLHPESDTSFFLNDEEDGEHSFVESQSSLNKQKMYKQKQIPLLSETVPTNKLLHGNSHVSHPQKNFIDENMRSNLYHHNQLQDFKKGMGDVQEESEHLLIQSYPSKTLLNTHSRLHCYAETENQSSNEYQINLQHEEIDEEFVPPEDLSGSDGEREKSKPVSESMESVMEELADTISQLKGLMKYYQKRHNEDKKPCTAAACI